MTVLTAADKIYLGTQIVNAVYAGAVKAWPKASGAYFTGGVETEVGGYKYHTFNSSGNLTLVGAGPVAVEYLVVAGGGGGGGNIGGGGGAGGLRAATISISATQTITIGGGGVGGTTGVGTDGTDSSLGSLVVSTAGGGGGAVGVTGPGKPGGSGGGGGLRGGGSGAGTVGQGSNGGTNFQAAGTSANSSYGAGGGGASTVGGDVPLSTPVKGGDGGGGAQWPAGSGTFYAGGGGGARNANGGTAGAGGAGGGGSGSPTGNVAGDPGTANTGGGAGGGGSGSMPGGVGGSGKVVVRYPTTPPATPSYFTGGVVTDVAEYRYHTFNTSGTLTFVPGDGPVSVEHLVVAGGGGGGRSSSGNRACGGGAGGMLTASASLSATQTVTIGAGGAGSIGNNTSGSDGTNSLLGAIVGVGGGGGAGSANESGRPGGSGGGACGAGLGGTPTSGQGFTGGNGKNGDIAGGGGGGAGAVGLAANADLGGDGGAGRQWPAGSAAFYGGGGGGAPASGTIGRPGGIGGGGTSGLGNASSVGSPGTPNTGGGGGGSTAASNGGTGGSGKVVVRYLKKAGMPPITELPPDAIAGLASWWDAADTATLTIPLGNGAVSQWNDKVGGRHFTQGTVASQPVSGTRTMNGRNVLDFIPPMSMLVTGVTIPQPYTIVAVGQFDKPDANTRYLFQSTGATLSSNASRWVVNGGANLIVTPDDTTPNIHICSFNGATSTYHINGVSKASGDLGATGLVAATFRLGQSTSGTTWDGTAAEVIIYNRILTDDERSLLTAHLKTKWGIA